MSMEFDYNISSPASSVAPNTPTRVASTGSRLSAAGRAYRRRKKSSLAPISKSSDSIDPEGAVMEDIIDKMRSNLLSELAATDWIFQHENFS